MNNYHKDDCNRCEGCGHNLEDHYYDPESNTWKCSEAILSYDGKCADTCDCEEEILIGDSYYE